MRPIKPKPLSDEEKETIRVKATKKLNDALAVANRIDDFKFTFNVKMDKPEALKTSKARVNFSADAWFKMMALVNHCTTECAWHGIVEASEDRKHFNINEILVYPQIVTGATVEQDDKDNRYEVWHQALSTPQYNNLRLQGHSHVNMAATPSGVDNNMYSNMLSALREDSYYIFMIINKNMNMWFNIYDLKNNILYENNDVEVSVSHMQSYEFFKAQKDLYISNRVTERTVHNTNLTNPTTGYTGYTGYPYADEQEELLAALAQKDSEEKTTLSESEMGAFFSKGDGPQEKNVTNDILKKDSKDYNPHLDLDNYHNGVYVGPTKIDKNRRSWR